MESKNKSQVFYTKKNNAGSRESSVGYPPKIDQSVSCGCKEPFKIQKRNSKTNFQG
jgi:hypothetical protein